jgi:hypothetical protein
MVSHGYMNFLHSKTLAEVSDFPSLPTEVTGDDK